jgi:hypothetical protein
VTCGLLVGLLAGLFTEWIVVGGGEGRGSDNGPPTPQVVTPCDTLVMKPLGSS